MEKFIELLSRYARAWAMMGQHVIAGERDAAIASAREVLALASELRQEDAKLEHEGVSLPATLSPYDEWYGKTAQELLSPAGLMVKGEWVKWPFSPEEIRLDPNTRY